MINQLIKLHRTWRRESGEIMRSEIYVNPGYITIIRPTDGDSCSIIQFSTADFNRLDYKNYEYVLETPEEIAVLINRGEM